MRTLTICFVWLLGSTALLACSFIPPPFCETAGDFPNAIIVRGKIVDKFPNGIDLQVLNTYRGDIATQSTITIWDGPDIDCNGTFTAHASDLGALDSTVLLLLPQIDSLELSWDVIGDYRCLTNFFIYAHALPQIGNDIVGLVGMGLQSVPVSDLTTVLSQCTNDINTQVQNPSNALPVMSISYFNHQLQLQAAIPDAILELYAISGQKVYQQSTDSQQLAYPLPALSSGMYITLLRTAQGRYSRKIIIN